MTENSDRKRDRKKLKLERLELGKQTMQDLTDLETEEAKGGMAATDTLKPIFCQKTQAP
jgi:hypothetical protein